MNLLPPVQVPHPHVVLDPRVLQGSPIVRGSHIPVRRLWSWFRGGVPIETLFKRYPQLGPARLLDVLAFAYDNPDVIAEDLARERALLDDHEARL